MDSGLLYSDTKIVTMEFVRRIVLFTFLSIVSVLIAVILLSNIFVVTDFGNVTHTWTAEPIVSVYIPSDYLNSNCKADYEPVFAYNTLNGISKGPCGCAKNLQGTLSSTTSCNANQEKNFACRSLPSLPAVNTLAWHSSVICIKRDGQAAATYHKKYHPRPQPDKHGQCPDGFKKCGIGRSQQEGAICFPFKAECPITNLLILPRNEIPLADDRWEQAGVFSDNYTLFVRREFLNELPITAITFRLTELSNKGISHNQRGYCYDNREVPSGYVESTDQVVNNPVVADSSKLWSYDITLPPICEVSDPRYTLVDQVPLQDHFLQNLQLTVPACAEFDLYPLSDPRYQAARDPDYLHSGVKCGSAPHYQCVRDPYQPTDCPAGDNICDGVVHQNTCGAYAHAVRSAFSAYKSKSVTLGMYFAREVQWADTCTTVKENLFHTGWIRFKMFVVKFILFEFWAKYNYVVSLWRWKIRFLYDTVGFPVTMLILYVLARIVEQMSDVYDAVENGDCTDSFTRDTLLDRLAPMKTTQDFIILTILILLLMTIEATIICCVTSHHYRLVRASCDDGEWHLELRNADADADAVGGATSNVYSAVATAEDSLVEVPTIEENGVELIDL